MSGSVLFSSAIHGIDKSIMVAEVELLIAVLSASDKKFHQLLYDIGSDALLPGNIIIKRAVPLIYEYSAIHFCDDLSDKECTYIPDSDRNGPAIIMILHNSFTTGLLHSDLPRIVLSKVLNHLTITGISQLNELKGVKKSSIEAYRLASNLNGTLFSLFFQIMWYRTKFQQDAEKIGQSVGILFHIINDVLQRDKRFYGLTKSNRTDLLNYANLHIQSLKKINCPSINRIFNSTSSKISAARSIR